MRNLIQKIALFLILSCITFSVQAQKWDAIGVNDSNWTTFNSRGGFYCDMAYTSTGMPYVVYSTLSNPYKMAVRKFENNKWSYVGPDTFSATTATGTKIAVDNNNVPYVLYIDKNWDVVVMKYNGTNWTKVGGNVNAGVVSGATTNYANIIFDATGTPYVVYSHNSGSSTSSVYILKFNGTAWVSVGATLLAGGTAYSDIAISSTGTPYVIYEDNITSKATVRKFDGTNWVLVGTAGFSTGTVEYTTIKLDRNDVPYVAYEDYAVSKKAVVQKFNGTSWVAVGVAQGNVPSGYAITDEDLAFDINNVPYLTYSEFTDNVILKKFDGSNWVDAATAGTLSGGANKRAYISIAADPTGGIATVCFDYGFSKVTMRKYTAAGANFVGDMGLNSNSSLTDIVNIASDNSGKLYTLYRDLVNGNKISVLTYNGNNWTAIGGIYTVNTATAWACLETDNSGVPYVYYADAVSGDAYLLKYNGTSWAMVGSAAIVTNAYKGTYGQLAFDQSNNPYVTFSDGVTFKPGVKKYNGLSWGFVGNNGFVNVIATLPIAVAKNGTPYVAFVDANNFYKTTVMKYDGTNWVSVGSPGFSTNRVANVDIAINAADSPYIAYVNDVVPADHYANVKKFDGNNWIYVGQPSFSPSAAYNITLHFGADNLPYIGYQDINHATVQRFKGGIWEDVGKTRFSAGSITDINFTITPAGKVYAAYINAGAYVRGYDIASLCTVPDTLTANAVGSHSTQLYWNVPANASSYEYIVTTTAGTPTTAGIPYTTNTVKVQGLKPNTFYYAFVRSKCSATDSSAWISTSFITTDTCITPVDTIKNITSGSVDIAWNKIANAKYEYLVITSSTPPLAGIITTDTVRHENSLNPDTKYYVHLRSICGIDTNAWTTLNFTTLKSGIGINKLDDNNMILYPNPAKNKITIQLSHIPAKGQVLLADIAGRTLRTIEITNERTDIDINDLVKGIYLLKYTDASQHIYITRFTKD